MPICTYLEPSQTDLPISNVVVAEALAWLRRRRPDDGWVVIEHRYVQSRIFRKPRQFYLYELLKHIGYTEYQIINFYSENADSSIYTLVPADLVVAYMYGALCK